MTNSSPEIQKEGNSLIISGSLKRGGTKRFQQQLSSSVKKISGNNFTLNLTNVSDIDSTGVSCLLQLIEDSEQRGVTVEVVGASDKTTLLMEQYSVPIEATVLASPRDILLSVGESVVNTWRNFVDLLVLISETFYWSIVGIVDRKGHRKGAISAQALAIGVGALPVIGLISFLIGIVLALQSAAQLRQFGANIFIADLIVIAMAREMGPLMTAIVLAGRSGASIAAEVSSMTVNEEIDALKTLAANPIRYVIVPKIFGITITAPLLSVMATLLGIVGGYLVAVNALDLSTTAFLNQAVGALFLKDLLTGLAKSFVFAWLIVILSAYYGFKVTGGPEGVGRATTKAVVASIFAVIVADAFLGLLFYL